MKTEITLDPLLIAFINTYCVMNEIDIDVFINDALTNRVKRLGYSPSPISNMDSLW